MVHPENAEIHILEDEAASRAFIDMMWAEVMFIYQNFPVKLTLSKTDVSEEMAADTDYFKKLFTNVKNVEVEVLKDAPSGTVIIDNGSEITDAGIQTQLKMIEELGRGKYRRAPSRKKAEKQEEPAAQAETDNDGGEEQSE